MLSGSATIASSQSFSMIQRRILLSPWPASPVNSDEPLCTSAMRLPSPFPCSVFHLAQHVGQEQHLAVARPRGAASTPHRPRAGWEGVVRKRRVLRAANDVVGGFAFAFQQEV